MVRRRVPGRFRQLHIGELGEINASPVVSRAIRHDRTALALPAKLVAQGMFFAVFQPDNMRTHFADQPVVGCDDDFLFNDGLTHRLIDSSQMPPPGRQLLSGNPHTILLYYSSRRFRTQFVDASRQIQFLCMINRRGVMRRWAKIVLGVGAAVLIWRSRVIQVASFLAAAGLRRSKQSGNGPATKATEWLAVKQRGVPNKALNPRVLVTYHPEYHRFEPDRVVKSFAAITELGAGWLRSDIRWRELLPNGRDIDLRALAWYRGFLRAAQEYKLRTMVVLSTPPDGVLQQSGAEKVRSWSHFVDVVVTELGADCSGYQLMNEPNGPIYGFLSRQEAIDAVARGASIIRRASATALVAVNISMEIWGWHAYLENMLKHSGDAIDIVGVDHYPGTWTVGRQEHWAEVVELADLISKAQPGMLWFGRTLAIMETGFSTNGVLRGERQQTEYFERIADIAKDLKLRMRKSNMLLGFYELCDGDSSAGLDPESHFGLLTSDLNPKSAFATVMHSIASL